jgi:hypothetical protein
MSPVHPHQIINVREPFEAIRIMACAPPCPTFYRGVFLYSANEYLLQYSRMIFMLAFQPQSILSRIASIYMEESDGDEVIIIHLSTKHQTKEDAEIVLEHLQAAGEVYGHGLMSVISKNGPFDGVKALPTAGAEGFYFEIDRWPQTSEAVQ